MAAGGHFEEIQRARSLKRIIRFTLCRPMLTDRTLPEDCNECWRIIWQEIGHLFRKGE